jgi:hypothetical protein
MWLMVCNFTTMVQLHNREVQLYLASMSPPPPLPPHARPVADYEGQEVLPLPPGVSRRRRDHPHGPLQPQPEVFVDIVSDDDE